MNTTDTVFNSMRKVPGQGVALDAYGPEEANRAMRFHKSFREYAPTPLVRLRGLARALGLGEILVKDESQRFGLNAFKVLGGSYAIGRILAERLGRPLEELGREELASGAVREQLGNITFVTATDGNHGRGVAWTAGQLGQNAVVFMPKGSAEIRAENIRATGAECYITDLNYDDAVRHANRYAAEHKGLMVQDTAWEGYEDIPRWIMQGYMTLVAEAIEQMRALGVERPTHMFLQAGVGSFASGALGHMAAVLGKDCPETVIAEPHNANCIYRSLVAADGKAHNVGGDMHTIMAGLACGEPSTVGWDVLRDYSAAGISCADIITTVGMRVLAAPLPGDAQVVSGESGAVTCGLLAHLMTAPSSRDTAARLGLGKSSKVLLISTEGDTSPEIYRDVVWYGNNYNEGRQAQW